VPARRCLVIGIALQEKAATRPMMRRHRRNGAGGYESFWNLL